MLDWQESKDKSDGHYQRFLYRVEHFCELFGDWFSVEHGEPFKDSKLNHAESLILNTAACIAKETPDERSPEARLEKRLVDLGWLAETFHMNPKKIGRQFPVGLFSGTVATSNMIFTGGKSAIDLVGIDKNGVLWVFELKAKGNQPLGIVSELLFYTAMMRDLAQGRFKHEGDKMSVPEGRLDPKEISRVADICGCLLAQTFHPLLDANLILKLLNNASASTGTVKVRYRSVELPSDLDAPLL